jgi:RNA polymerase sigma-70 factor (ECF subfamily)
MNIPEHAVLRRIPAESTAELVEAVVRQHAKLVYQVVFAALRHPQEAEDAVQETFIRVFKHAGELSKVVNIRAWLARIAWRIASDWRRKHLKPVVTSVDDLPELPAAGTSAEEDVIRAQQVALLERMIGMLPDDLREVVELSTVDELTSVEIGQALGIPESSVRGRLVRARQLLREKVQGLMERNQKAGVKHEHS